MTTERGVTSVTRSQTVVASIWSEGALSCLLGLYTLMSQAAFLERLSVARNCERPPLLAGGDLRLSVWEPVGN